MMPGGKAPRIGPVCMEITLPFPPSVNRYWRTYRGRVLISREGRKYRDTAVPRSANTFGDSMVRVVLEVHPPDRRKRDLDNICKAVLDALGHAGVYQDDYQVCDLQVIRKEVRQPGEVVATITKAEADT